MKGYIMINNNPYKFNPYMTKTAFKPWFIPTAITAATGLGLGGKFAYDQIKEKRNKEFSWDKVRPYAVPTIAGLGGAGLSYGVLGAIPAFRRNAVLRLLASGVIGAATAGGAYYLDNVYGKDKGIMDTIKGWKDTITNKLS